MLHLLPTITTTSTSTTTTTTSTATMPMPNPSSSSGTSLPSQKPRKPSSSSSSSLLCKHSPSATLDILILILVLFSCTFLIISCFSYIFQSLSQILPSLLLAHSNSFRQSPVPYVLGFLALFTVSVVGFEICCSYRSRKCENPGCKGLKKAMEFDIQLQTEECLRNSGSKEIDKLPWKGGTEGNPDYECLRSELRKMAPPNGRAVLLFRARCGCPVAKLEAWGAKRGRRHKKALSVLDGGGAHR